MKEDTQEMEIWEKKMETKFYTLYGGGLEMDFLK